MHAMDGGQAKGDPAAGWLPAWLRSTYQGLMWIGLGNGYSLVACLLIIS